MRLISYSVLFSIRTLAIPFTGVAVKVGIIVAGVSVNVSVSVGVEVSVGVCVEVEVGVEDGGIGVSVGTVVFVGFADSVAILPISAFVNSIESTVWVTDRSFAIFVNCKAINVSVLEIRFSCSVLEQEIRKIIIKNIPDLITLIFIVAPSQNKPTASGLST